MNCIHGLPPGCCAICIDIRREAERASERAVARLAGMTLAEFDRDATAPDPRPAGDEEVRS